MADEDDPEAMPTGGPRQGAFGPEPGSLPPRGGLGGVGGADVDAAGASAGQGGGEWAGQVEAASAGPVGEDAAGRVEGVSTLSLLREASYAVTEASLAEAASRLDRPTSTITAEARAETRERVREIMGWS